MMNEFITSIIEVWVFLLFCWVIKFMYNTLIGSKKSTTNNVTPLVKPLVNEDKSYFVQVPDVDGKEPGSRCL